MQILNRKKGDEFIRIEVIRIWQDNAGIQIGLTPSGDYITLDGELVEDPQLFAIMPSAERKKAEGWWRQLQDKREAEAKAKAEGVPVPSKTEPSQDQLVVAPDDGGAVAVVAEVMQVMQRQQQEFLKALSGVLGSGAEPVPKSPKLKALYSCRKGTSAIIKSPRDWDELDFEEQPEWWGTEELMTIDVDGAKRTYQRFFVPDEGGGGSGD